MTTVRVTVLIPTHDHGPTLFLSAKSVLAQTIRELEVFIVGDGVPSVTRRVVERLQQDDERVRFFDLPKGPRHGEIHRHAALAHARGRIVCYLSDDDLWLPYHLATMERLLAAANFAHTLAVAVTPEGRLQVLPHVDFALPGTREALVHDTLRFNPSLSSIGHTLEMYRRLPFGWRTTPAGTPTDRYMWRQFLEHSECRPVSSTHPTFLAFPSPARCAWSPEQRAAELERWFPLLADAKWLAEFPGSAFDALARAHRYRPRQPTSARDQPHVEREKLRIRYERLGAQHLKCTSARAALEADCNKLRSKVTRLRRELEDRRSVEMRLRAELARVPSSAAPRLSSWLARVPVLGPLLKSAARWVSHRPAR